MFAVRKVGPEYRLCVRRGVLIEATREDDGTPVPIKFRTQASGKACIDRLNEECLEEWESYFTREVQLKVDKAENQDNLKALRNKMNAIIKQHI